MPRKKTVPKPDLYASADTKDVRFGRIYPGQLQSEAFKKLPLGTRYFYLLCRAQEQSDEGRRSLYKHAAEYGREYPEGCFVFPASAAAEYGFDKGNASRHLQRLAEAGFIKIIEQNGPRHIINIYRFSDEWRK